MTVGTINSSGLYTAPATVPSTSVTVVATANSVPSAPSAVTITSNGNGGSPSGSGSGATQSTLFTDGFESGNWSAWGGGTPSGVSITSGLAASGTHSATVTHTAGTGSTAWAETYFGDLNGSGATQNEVTQEFDSYFTPNADINAVSGGGTKLSILICNQDWTSIYPQPLPFSPFYLTLYSDPKFNVSAELHRKTATPDVWQSWVQNVGSSAPLTLGKWQHVKVHVKLNTPGISDGLLEMWINGVQTMEYTNINFRDSYTMRGWNMYEITGYDDQSGPPTTTWNQYWDNVNIYVP